MAISSDIVLISTVSGLSGVVLILIIVLIIICVRRKRRGQEIQTKDQILRRDTTQSESQLSSASDTAYQANLITNDIEKQDRRPRTNAVRAVPTLGTNMQVPAANPRSPRQADDHTDYMNASGDYMNHPSKVKHAGFRPPVPPPVSPRSTNSETTLVSSSEVASIHSYGTPAIPARHRRSDRERSREEQASELFQSHTKAFHHYINQSKDYEMERKDLMKQGKLGKGHFGHVYKGFSTELPFRKGIHTTVAIKTLKHSSPDSEKQEFLYEVEIMKLVSTLNHSNIIKILGCVTKSQPCALVLEYMANGNLQKFLRDTKCNDEYYNLHGNSNSITEQQLLRFALEIAQGMEGLAELQLLHRDLAARNILLDEKLTCKIADFGFAKDILNKPEYKSKSVFVRPRPTRWLPPESLFKFKHSIRSDVWSYGVTLWEIVTLGNLPYPKMDASEVYRAIQKGYRMSCPRHCSKDLYDIMSKCWKEESQKRPTFTQLVKMMAHLLNDAGGAINMAYIEDDIYVQDLPPEELEIQSDYATAETLC